MITISEASPLDFKTIQDIAYKTWPDTYGVILSQAQLDYMLDNFYSEATLNENFSQKNHRFLLLKEADTTLGFASYEHNYNEELCTRVHKIYLLPKTQGKGLGKLLIDKMAALAVESGSKKLSLNVNRFNKAFAFYKKIGFDVIKEEDIAIGNGYLMEDYVMEKRL